MTMHSIRSMTLRIFLVTLMTMVAYEFLKEVLTDGTLSLIQSHAITVIFVSCWATVIGWVVIKRLDSLHAAAANANAAVTSAAAAATEDATAKLRGSKARFQRMMDGSHDGHWEWYVGKDENYLSPRWKNFLGYEDHEMPNVQASFFNHIHPDDASRVAEAVRRHLEERTTYEIEHRLRCKNGEYRWFSSRGKATWDEKGQLISMAGSITDITARKQAEEELRTSRENLQSILETSLDGYWQVDLQGRLTDVNAAACAMLGYTKPEMLGLRVTDITVIDNEEGVKARIEKIMETGGDRFESRHRRKDGNELDVEVSINLVPSIQRVSVFVRDITGSKATEKSLIAARNEAERANVAKSLFLALVSHDLRTPMNGVLGMLELVLDTSLSAEQKGCLDVAQSSAQSMVALLNDILDMSKMESGKMALEQVPFDIKRLLSETVQSLSISARKKGLNLFYHIDERVPSHLMGDPTRLRQVITNLIGNAIKFTQQGHIVLKVAIEQSGTNGITLGFIIQDTGIGIAPENQLSIFDAFTQADASTSRQFGGTGLGLAICRQLVALMGGNICVESQIGRGSAFLFTAQFLLAKENVSNEEGSASPTEFSYGTRTGTSLSILLAEDVTANQKFFMTVLAKAGHSVMLAQDGEEAIAHAKASHFDVILMDIGMPLVDGFEATKAIRAYGIGTPIIALTAHVIPGFRDQCVAAGMSDYLSKPVKSRDLLNKIMELHANFSTRASKNAPDALEVPPERELLVFDTATALDMTGGDLSIQLKVLLLTREQIAQQMPEIEAAVIAQDAQSLREVCHALKSSLGLIGAFRAQQVCASLEVAAKNTDTAAFGDLLQKLKVELATLLPAIDDYIGMQADTGTMLIKT
ncbi:MAG: PAS domain S-box protein [Rhodoferax sp.]|nr:PAS domain S-box protein [Rhodoferax sp.]